MHWAASVVYLADTPASRAVLTTEPKLANHIWAVDLTRVEHSPAIVPGFDGRILAIRSPIRRQDVGMVRVGFDWAGLDGDLSPRLTQLRGGLTGASARIFPPDAAVRWLEVLAARVAAPVVWYMAESTGGDPEAEFALVLDWRGSARVGDEEIQRLPAIYSTVQGRRVRIDGTGLHGVSRDPLGAGLLHLGVRLEGPWFTLHSPGFDWSEHRLSE